MRRRMNPEQLVDRIRETLPTTLRSAVLYGSAAAGDFRPDFSNYNLLVVLERLGIGELNALCRPVAAWTRDGNDPPMVFAADALAASADVFPIEFADICQTRRVLYGPDPVAGLAIHKSHLRLQLERELKGKLLQLRERYLMTGSDRRRVVELMAASLSTFLVLFRAALRLYCDDPPPIKREALTALTQFIAFDSAPFLAIGDFRQGSRKFRDLHPESLFAGYLTGIEKVITAVDNLQTQ